MKKTIQIWMVFLWCVCLTKSEPFLNGKQATFLIVSKISETEQATPPCRRFAAATPQQIFLLP